MALIQTDSVVLKATRLQGRALLSLESRSSTIQREVELACSKHLSRTVTYGSLSIENKCRLLSLQALADKHFLSLREVLHAILDTFPPERCRYWTHAIPLSYLAGPQSQHAVATYVLEHYPLGEQKKAWSCDQSNLILATSAKPAALDLDDLRGSYRGAVDNNRARRQLRTQQLQRRPYRRNPFK